MIFTSEDGQKYEVVGRPILPSDEKEFVIRPVKQEPKYKITSDISFKTPTSDYQVIQLQLDVSKDQAQLIKEAVETLMQFIFTKSYLGAYPNSTANKARQSMRENN